SKLANGSRSDGLIEVRRGFGQGIEWPAIIGELDAQTIAFKLEYNLGGARFGSIDVSILQQIRKQLFEDDRYPRPIGRLDPVPQRKFADELAHVPQCIGVGSNCQARLHPVLPSWLCCRRATSAL
ncbi:MAG TPA: hypothetical protein VJX23_02240, partial [Candidatus Binataceae bacterium]|nr:hypothetical protein [Candidatus Binataceae bacterium]